MSLRRLACSRWGVALLLLAAWLCAGLYVGVLFVHLYPRCFPGALADAADSLVFVDETTLLVLDEVFHAAAERMELTFGDSASFLSTCMAPEALGAGSCALWGCFAGAYPCPYLD